MRRSSGMEPSLDKSAVPAAHAAFARSLSAARLVLSLVAAVSALSSSSWRDPLPVEVVLLVVGVAVMISGREGLRWKRGRAAVPDLAMIVVDAALGVAVLVTLGESAGLVGWLAMLVPVAEALVWTGALAATLTWVAMAGSFVVLSVMAGIGLPQVLLELLRHAGGSVLVAVPGWAAGAMIGRELTRIDEMRRVAGGRAESLSRVGEVARRISAAADAEAVLSAAVESAMSMGFDAANVAVVGTDGVPVAQKLAGDFVHGIPESTSNIPDAAGRVVAADSIIDAQVLHRLGFARGHAFTVVLDDAKLTLWVWRVAEAPVGVEDPEIVEILANQCAVAWAQATDRQNLSRRAEDLEHDAKHDVLTGLSNRSGLLEFLDEVVSTGRHDVALLFIDLDGFKSVNDQMGHEAGDEVLRMVAGRIKDCVGSGFVGRLGGDEFIVAINSETVQHAATTGSRIILGLKAPMTVEGRQIRINGSVGVSLVDPTLGVPEILRRADRAMYAAKRAGGGRVAAVRV